MRYIMMSLAIWRLCCRVGQLRSCSSVVTLALAVFSLKILIGGDFRIIDGEKIQPRVGRPPVGSM